MKKDRILIVDDNEVNCKLLYILLRNQPYEFLYARNVKDAVFKCLNEPINLVLMDLNMPVMDGLEAGKTIKEFKPDMPIILNSAFSNELNSIKNLHRIFNFVLAKPIVPKSLIEKINQCLFENNNSIAC